MHHGNSTTLRQTPNNQGAVKRCQRDLSSQLLRASLQEFRTWMATEAAMPILHRSIKAQPPPVAGSVLTAVVKLNSPRKKCFSEKTKTRIGLQATA